jgi:hypothetical protein
MKECALTQSLIRYESERDSKRGGQDVMKSRIIGLIVVWTSCLASHCFAGDLLNLSVASASRGVEPTVAVPALDLRLSDSDRSSFAAWTARHVGRKVRIMIGGRVIRELYLPEPIDGGSFLVIGPTVQEIDALIPRLLDGRSAVAVDVKD